MSVDATFPAMHTELRSNRPLPRRGAPISDTRLLLLLAAVVVVGLVGCSRGNGVHLTPLSESTTTTLDMGGFAPGDQRAPETIAPTTTSPSYPTPSTAIPPSSLTAPTATPSTPATTTPPGLAPGPTVSSVTTGDSIPQSATGQPAWCCHGPGRHRGGGRQDGLDAQAG
jgi:hypothetical protein